MLYTTVYREQNNMLYIILTLAFLAITLFISAIILVVRFRKTHKYALFLAHRATAISGVVVAVVHGLLAYNFFVHKFF
jgi:Na+/proline symporter